MEDYEKMTLGELATTIDNWKILCLDRTYPEKYQLMIDLFNKRVKEDRKYYCMDCDSDVKDEHVCDLCGSKLIVSRELANEMCIR